MDTSDSGGVDAGADVGADGSVGDAAHVDVGTDAGSDAAADDGGPCVMPDQDHDGHDATACGGNDCDDGDAHRFPGNTEVCDATGHDEDCDPSTFGTTDVDGDGHVSGACCNTDGGGAMHCGDDCDDTRVDVHPGATEVCNGLDDDCDSAVDEGVLRTFHRDSDGDGYGCTCADTMTGCNPPTGYIEDSTDCDDAHAVAHPGGTEVCDGFDDDCDGQVDEEPIASASCAPLAHGTAQCISGACGLGSCDAGYHACSGACATSTSTLTCGTSCTACPAPPPHGSATCDGTSCGIACDVGYVLVGSSCDIAPPRPIVPLSTSTVTSRTPTLQWALASGTDGARVEICADRACTTILATIDVLGTSAVPPSNLPVGVVYWRLHGRIGTTTGTSTGPTWQFIVGALTAPIESSWGTTLDVDGDGHADVVVGAYGAASSAGRVYVYRGSATGLSTSPATVLDGPDGAGGQFGFSVASAGDVDGDGFADVIVGAYGVSSNTGSAYLYLGGPSGLSTTPRSTLTSPAGTNGLYGLSVAAAGDVNRDGYGDVIIGAPGALSGTGRVYVYSGGPSGISFASEVVLNGLDGTGADFGASVAGAGDVNGDGYADVIVGAHGAGSNAGDVRVYHGGAAGLSTSPAITLLGPGASLSLYGCSVASAGDVTADGYADIVVGASGVSTNTGAAYVYVGGSSGIGSTVFATLTGPDGVQGDFGNSVASLGDMDGNGFSDLVVGAYGVTVGGNSRTGRAYVYRAGLGALGTTVPTTLTGLDGANGYFGYAVAGAGDVNGDTHPDVLVGAYSASSATGRAYLYLGTASAPGTTPATTLTGPDGAGGAFGYSVASAEDVEDEHPWCSRHG